MKPLRLNKPKTSKRPQKPKPKSTMKSILLTLVALTLTNASCAIAGPYKKAYITTQKDGTTIETRYILNHPAQRSGTILSKLLITRDANGKIISVRRV
jgi:hypothetical protein